MGWSHPLPVLWLTQRRGWGAALLLDRLGRGLGLPVSPYLRAREERKNCQRGQLFTVFRSQDRKMGQACASLAEAVL